MVLTTQRHRKPRLYGAVNGVSRGRKFTSIYPGERPGEAILSMFSPKFSTHIRHIFVFDFQPLSGRRLAAVYPANSAIPARAIKPDIINPGGK